MSQPSNTENLENIIRKDAAFPYDGLITQVFATTVNVMPVGSRTVLRDVALPAHIKSEDVQIGYAVRLDQTAAKPTVLAIFEQFADPEMYNYAGLGVKVPATPNVTVKATKNGWVVTWNAIQGATKYILYKNDTPDGTSPEEVIQLGAGTLTYTVAFEEPFIYFAVKACSGYLESDVSLWMTDMTPPDTPTWKNHAYQTTGHYLEWTHAVPSDVKEFIIYRNWQLGDQFAAETTRTANLNTIVDYVEQSDYFGVQAVDWSGRNKSAIVWWGPFDPTPATPANFTANLVEGGGYYCAWNATAKAVSYIVQSSDNSIGENGDPIVTIYTGAELRTQVVLNPNYTLFRVAAIGIDGSMSAWSSWKTDNNPPPQPTLDVVNGVQQITVSLAVNDTSHSSVGFSHYIIQVSDFPNGSSPTIADDHALYPSFPHVVAQAPGTTKYYSLIPVDWAGNQGPASAWLPAYSFTLDGAPNIQDKFDTYGGTALTPIDSLYWLSLAKVEQAESWTLSPGTLATWVSTNLIEGSKAIRLVSNSPGLATYIQLAKAMNLTQEGRFTNDDYLVIQTRIADMGNQKVTIIFYNTTGFPGGSGYKRTFDTTVDFPSPFVAKRSAFQAYGASPNWATIAGIQIYVENVGMQNLDLTLDDIRIVKADPEDATKYNDTGLAWDYTKNSDIYGDGEWHIYPGNRTGEPYKPFSFGQVNMAYGTPDHWYLAHKPMGTDVVVGTIQAGIFHKENGQNGLAFYIKDVTVDHWTMYAIETDNVGDTVKLVKWVDGVRTELGSASFAFISAAGGTTGQTIWVGADFSDYDSDGGRIKVYASTIEGNLIQANNLKISVQDTSIGSGGSVGLLSYQSNVRFVNFTAGSPAHAEVADVAKALDGPIVAGAVRRVQYDLALNRFTYTDDGQTFNELSAIADPNKVDKTSANRPGVTRLYRRDSDTDYSIQTDYVAAADGTNRWRLRGYLGDTFHQECFTAYANVANAANVANYLGNTSNNLAALKATGAIVYRSTDITGVSSGYYAVPMSAYYSNTMGGWDSSTAIYAQRTGWHFAFCGCGIQPAANSDNLAICLVYNGNYFQYQQERRPASTNAVNFSVGAFIYMTAGQYVQMQTYCTVSYTVMHTFSTCKLGLLSLELA